jgi:hypothetical protein
MHKEKLAPRTATAIINSHLIRTARMLAQMARVLGQDKDMADYEEDITLWSEALQKHSWDAEADFAFKITHTALDLWKAEADESYDCFEHFLIESGRGAGWHQFSALSSPVLAWFSAYYRPGRLTAGFDTWVHRCEFERNNTALDAELELLGRSAAEATVLVTLAHGRTHHARWNGKPVPAHAAASGTLQVTLPRDAGRGRLQVESA